MPRLSTILLTTCTMIITALSPAAADLVVNSWELDTGIIESTPNGDTEFAVNSLVMNPFQTTRTASIGNSSTTATYDFGWLGDFAHFDAYTNHHLEQLDGRTVSEGRIRVIPAIDTNISFNGRWQFSWPGSVIGDSLLSMGVYDLVADELLVHSVAIGGNYAFGPPFGTLTVQNNALLLAGGEYEIDYTTLIDQDDPTPPGTHGEGSGEVHFSLTPIPEPATLGLFAFAFLIPCRRCH